VGNDVPAAREKNENASNRKHPHQEQQGTMTSLFQGGGREKETFVSDSRDPGENVCIGHDIEQRAKEGTRGMVVDLREAHITEISGMVRDADPVSSFSIGGKERGEDSSQLKGQGGERLRSGERGMGGKGDEARVDESEEFLK